MGVFKNERIAHRLRHLDAVGEQVLAVRPDAHYVFAGVALALGDFALVVGEYVVHAAGVDVKALAEVFDGHSGAFNMPAGETLAPLALPFELAAGFGGFPKGEIAGIALEGVGVNADGL